MIAGEAVFDLVIDQCMVCLAHQMHNTIELERLDVIQISGGVQAWIPRDPRHTSDEGKRFQEDVIETLTGEPETIWVGNVTRIPVHLRRSLPSRVDIMKVSKYLLYRPNEVISKTLQSTTQLAKARIRTPVKRHYKSRFKRLRQPPIYEIVAKNTYFSSVKFIEGFRCCQIFFGCTSRTTSVYVMRSESDFIEAYKDFMRERGIPHTLRRDNARAETSDEVTNIDRELMVMDETTEPYSPWQNPAEVHGMTMMKAQTQVIMYRSGAPPECWNFCQEYLAEVHSHCANRQLGWKTPMEAFEGDTQDISHLIPFHFFEKVLYLDPTVRFPHSKEQLGRFVVYARNTGEPLTFKILTQDTGQIIARSVVRSAEDRASPNLRLMSVDPSEDESLEELDPLVEDMSATGSVARTTNL